MTDTERLIEEANGFYSASTEAMCLVANLAAALRAERERAEKAERERDAQHEQVLRLTGERDAVAKDLARIRAVSAIAGSVAHWDSLLNEMHEQKARAQRAEQERDAQAALVATLTAERDEARVQLRAANDFLRVVTLERDHAQQVEVPDAFWRLDEAQAQVWGLICVATNCAIKADESYPALRQVLDQRAELTATRDLLTAENTRLQKERDEDRAELEHSRGNVWALMCLFTNEDNMGRHLKAVIKDLRAQIATLELLRRGGK